MYQANFLKNILIKLGHLRWNMSLGISIQKWFHQLNSISKMQVIQFHWKLRMAYSIWLLASALPHYYLPLMCPNISQWGAAPQRVSVHLDTLRSSNMACWKIHHRSFPAIILHYDSTGIHDSYSGWWFQRFFIFHNIWEFHHPNWRTLIFQRGRAQPPTSIGPIVWK